VNNVSNFVFRVRYALHFVIFLLGFTAPWNLLLHLDPVGINAHAWGLLAQNLHNLGLGSYLDETRAFLLAGIVLACAGALLRTWGAAYLGSNIVKSDTFHASADTAVSDGILKDGPFAHLRNPLYVGTFLHTLALSLLMPPTGALFAIAAIAGLQSWLIAAEETFLRQTLGTPYLAYCALVPSIVPSLRARIPASGSRPRWPQAILGETYFWGVALALALGGWFYNPALLTQCVVVSVGVSLVARAFVGQQAR
jgi:protein-S-isoprenylcysteine O-methyltransferase Ste14